MPRKNVFYAYVKPTIIVKTSAEIKEHYRLYANYGQILKELACVTSSMISGARLRQSLIWVKSTKPWTTTTFFALCVLPTTLSILREPLGPMGFDPVGPSGLGVLLPGVLSDNPFVM